MRLFKKVFSNITTGLFLSLGFFGGILILVKAASLTATSGSPLTASNWNNMVSNFFWGSGSGGIFYNGKIGIGTSAPNKNLHIYNTDTNAEIDLQSVSGSGKHWAIYQDATTQELRLWNEYDRFKLTTGGNLNVQGVCINGNCKTDWSQVSAQAGNIKSCTCSDANAAICIQTFDGTNWGSCNTISCKTGFTKDNNIDATCLVLAGICGSSNLQIASSTPSTNLCSAGNASSVSYSSSTGTYNWTCSGGVPTSCRAYDSYTKLLLHFNGTNGSTSIIDLAGNSPSAVGSAKIYTANYKFGASSIYVDGTNSYISVPSSSNFVLGTSDFTIEGWINISDSNASAGYLKRIISNGYDANSFQIMIDTAGKLGFRHSNSSVTIGSTTNVFGAWHHFAVTRASGALKLFIDGILESSTTDNTNLSTNQDLILGAYRAERTSANNNTIGYLDEIRISKGIARRTSNFTPPTTEY